MPIQLPPPAVSAAAAAAAPLRRCCCISQSVRWRREGGREREREEYCSWGNISPPWEFAPILAAEDADAAAAVALLPICHIRQTDGPTDGPGMVALGAMRTESNELMQLCTFNRRTDRWEGGYPLSVAAY